MQGLPSSPHLRGPFSHLQKERPTMKNGRHVSTLRTRSNSVRSLEPGPVGREVSVICGSCYVCVVNTGCIPSLIIEWARLHLIQIPCGTRRAVHASHTCIGLGHNATLPRPCLGARCAERSSVWHALPT